MYFDEFDEQIRDNLYNIACISDLNETQRYLLFTMLNIFSNGNDYRFINLFKEYSNDIEKVKDLFRIWLKDIDLDY